MAPLQAALNTVAALPFASTGTSETILDTSKTILDTGASVHMFSTMVTSARFVLSPHLLTSLLATALGSPSRTPAPVRLSRPVLLSTFAMS
jgi:hypothetical protein